jgi:hypothetical protein
MLMAENKIILNTEENSHLIFRYSDTIVCSIKIPNFFLIILVLILHYIIKYCFYIILQIKKLLSVP